jgi:hypothetical protein
MVTKGQPVDTKTTSAKHTPRPSDPETQKSPWNNPTIRRLPTSNTDRASNILNDGTYTHS